VKTKKTRLATMKSVFGLMVITGSVFWAPLMPAHEGHEHASPLDQSSALESASLKMVELIEAGQLEHFWSSRDAENAQVARVNGLQNWIISYLDAESRNRLEVIFSMTGEFVSFSIRPLSDTASN
jgi:hypothetical protein